MAKWSIMIRMFSLYDCRGKFLLLFILNIISFLFSFKHWFNYVLLYCFVVLFKGVRFVRNLKFDDFLEAIVLLFRLAYFSILEFVFFDYLTIICHLKYCLLFTFMDHLLQLVFHIHLGCFSDRCRSPIAPACSRRCQFRVCEWSIFRFPAHVAQTVP